MRSTLTRPHSNASCPIDFNELHPASDKVSRLVSIKAPLSIVSSAVQSLKSALVIEVTLKASLPIEVKFLHNERLLFFNPP